MLRTAHLADLFDQLQRSNSCYHKAYIASPRSCACNYRFARINNELAWLDLGGIPHQPAGRFFGTGCNVRSVVLGPFCVFVYNFADWHNITGADVDPQSKFISQSGLFPADRRACSLVG